MKKKGVIVIFFLNIKMNIKEKLLNRGKEYYEKKTKKDCENKQEINIQHYLTKKDIKGEIDIKICLKKINKD